MKKTFFLIHISIFKIFLIGSLFVSCNKQNDLIDKKSDITVVVSMSKAETFELGYIIKCTVIKIIKGEVSLISGKDSTDKKIITLIFPPVDIPEIYKNLSNQKTPDYNILNIKKTGKSIDEIDLFSPNPGSGMGEFLPPGILSTDGKYWKLTKVYGVSKKQLDDFLENCNN